MTKLFGSFALAAMTFAAAPQSVLAYDIPVQASFAVAYSATPNVGHASYCGESLDLAVEAHGDGFSSLGALSFSLLKTISFTGALHGCLTLTAPNGDSLTAIYDGSGVPGNANNFSSASGTLTFTGGTGRFRGAKGKATFTAVFDNFYPASSFAGGTNTAPIQGMAFYLVQGQVSIGGGEE
jgi:hypothetical protein